MPVDAMGRYVPEEVIAQQYKQADELSNQHWSPTWAGVLAAGLGGIGGGMMRNSAQNALQGNQDMRGRALSSAMGAPDNVSMARVLLGSGVPGLDEKGMGMMADERHWAADMQEKARQRALDRAAEFEQRKALGADDLQRQKALYEYQRRLQMELKAEENKQNMDLMNRILGKTGADAADTAQGATDGANAGPVANPPNAFADDLLGGLHHTPTTEEKAATAIALGSKDKAIDILNEKGNLTEGQTKDASFAERILRSEADMNEVAPIDEKGNYTKYNPAKAEAKLWPNQSMFNSDQWKRYYRAGSETLAAILRKDTGAAVTPQEWDYYAPLYLPQPMDPPAVVLEKRRARIAMARGLRNGSGPAFDRMFPGFNEQMRQRITALGGSLTPPTGPQEAAKQVTSFDDEASIPEGATVKDDQGNMLVKKNGKLVPVEPARIGPGRSSATQ